MTPEETEPGRPPDERPGRAPAAAAPEHGESVDLRAARRALEASDLRDRMELRSRALDHLAWIRLPILVALGLIFITVAVLGFGRPALAVAAVFLLLTARGLLQYRRGAARLKELDEELAELGGGDSA